MRCVIAGSEDLDSADQLNVDLMIPTPNNVHDFQLLKVHSSCHDRTLAYINISSTLLVPPYLGGDGKSFHSCLAFVHDQKKPKFAYGRKQTGRRNPNSNRVLSST